MRGGRAWTMRSGRLDANTQSHNVWSVTPPDALCQSSEARARSHGPVGGGGDVEEPSKLAVAAEGVLADPLDATNRR